LFVTVAIRSATMPVTVLTTEDRRSNAILAVNLDISPEIVLQIEIAVAVEEEEEAVAVEADFIVAPEEEAVEAGFIVAEEEEAEVVEAEEEVPLAIIATNTDISLVSARMLVTIVEAVAVAVAVVAMEAVAVGVEVDMQADLTCATTAINQAILPETALLKTRGTFKKQQKKAQKETHCLFFLKM